MAKLGLAWLFVIAIVVMAAGSAIAASPLEITADEAMRFALVRSDMTGCEPDCPQWISAEGGFAADTASRFRKFLKRNGSKKYPVVISSQGGDVDAAMEFGRIVRKLGVAVVVGSTRFSGCAPAARDCKLEKSAKGVYSGAVSDYGICLSACPLALAGGVERIIGKDAVVAIHQFTNVSRVDKLVYNIRYKMVNGVRKEVGRTVVKRKKGKEKVSTVTPAKTVRKVKKYLSSMGVQPEFYDRLAAVPAASLQMLGAGDLFSFGLVNGVSGGTRFLRTERCRIVQGRPDFCVEKKGARKQKPSASPAAEDGSARLRESPVDYPDDEWMRFVLVRSADRGCEPTCPQWISAEGPIVAKTPADFKRFMDWVGNRRFPMLLSSPGGDIDGALELAKLVRKSGLDVAIGVTRFNNCDSFAACYVNQDPFAVQPGIPATLSARCFGACPAVLAAGQNRYAGTVPALSLLQVDPSRPAAFAGSIETARAAKLPEEMGARMRKHFIAMGVDPEIYAVGGRFTQEKVLNLEFDDMLRLHLVTSLKDATALLEATGCRITPLPEYCVLRSAPAPAPRVAPKQARSDDPMQFSIVRRDSHCGYVCPQWISAEGRIVAETPDRLRELLARTGAMDLPVVLSSTGGDMRAAIRTGRLLRVAGMRVIVGRTRLSPCAEADLCGPGVWLGEAQDSDSYCFGACTAILAGGTERFANSAAHVNLRDVLPFVALDGRYRIVVEEGESLELSPQDRSILASHFRAMGVDRELAFRDGQLSGGRVVDLSASLLMVNALAFAGEVEEVVGNPLECAPPARRVNCVAGRAPR